MNNNQTNNDMLNNFPDEIAYLEEINNKIDETLQQSDDRIKQTDTDYMEFKRYTLEHNIDPHEAFQNELLLKQVDRSGAFLVKMRKLTEKSIRSPYFARIDFIEKDNRAAVTRYIGVSSFMYENELLIIDWRSPFASMFYDYELGPAGYDAPQKRIEGELSRKRQFKIVNRKLIYVLESSMNIQDDILQRELSQTSDDKMKSIIATIQKEQNLIIRNEESETLIIQGVGGSGKTSIALHRVAFLLYRFKQTLKAKDVTIISPNKVFGNYISNVLPELGEEKINQSSFADIAMVLLDGTIIFEPDKDPLETNDAAWAERTRFKSTFAFLKLMDDYIEKMTASIFEPEDFIHGKYSVSEEWIWRRYNAYREVPVKERLKKIAEDIYERFDAQKVSGNPAPRPPAILKRLNKMLKAKNTFALYEQFYTEIKMPTMFFLPAKKTFEYNDVFPFMYLHAAFEGLREIENIKHLVIDEMQDYTPTQYAVIKKLFHCPMTILGDFGQRINPNHLHDLEDLQNIFHQAELFELTKSYRSSYEIISFAKNIYRANKIEPIERHGEHPEIISCENDQDEIIKIKSKLDAFLKSEYASLAIVLKTNTIAEYFFKKLSDDYKVHLISPKSTHFTNGITITSVQMSKGLEFDEVIIPNVNLQTYNSEHDRNLLYIACTRAMHKLTLSYTEQVSPLVVY
jgi:DNA helicase-2/ATP-dependent DNA helicase PcrA